MLVIPKFSRNLSLRLQALEYSPGLSLQTITDRLRICCVKIFNKVKRLPQTILHRSLSQKGPILQLKILGLFLRRTNLYSNYRVPSLQTYKAHWSIVQVVTRGKTHCILETVPIKFKFYNWLKTKRRHHKSYPTKSQKKVELHLIEGIRMA